LFIKYKEYETIWEQIEKLIGKQENNKMCGLEFSERIISTGENFAYLRIAEGCSNRCTYCAIPYIRGKFVSRKMEDVLEEANKLVNQGYKELIVIAQDTSKYGIDIYGEPKLAELLEKLAKIKDVKWIRFLYAYPESIDSKLIKVVKENDKICNYFDIPIQHISDKVLKMMARKTTGDDIRKIISKIRKEIPDVILRTSLIVGFPGETEEDFFELYEFVNEAKFDKLGVFKYSKEEGTPASRIKNGTVHPKTKEARRNKIMSLEKQISKIKLEEKIGNVYEAIVYGFTIDNEYIIARSYMDIPDEDGVIYIKNDNKTKIGDFIKCEITDTIEYDLVGKKIK
jgi:ribosomal protein S12 methylthiotransferase